MTEHEQDENIYPGYMINGHIDTCETCPDREDKSLVCNQED